jgi:hypothetical protein
MKDDGKLFVMQLHVPYFVLKRQKNLREDPRKRADGETAIRASRDLSFMQTPGSTDSSATNRDCLYSTQFSFMVTGFNKDIYTAYCLVDTYHNDQEDDENALDGVENSDGLERYVPGNVYSFNEDGEEEATGVNWDPISGGRLDADKTIWEPQEYFLRVCNLRLEDIQEHWQEVTEKFSKEVNVNVRIVLLTSTSRMNDIEA